MNKKIKNFTIFFLVLLLFFLYNFQTFSQNNKIFIPREYKDFKLGMDINSFKIKIAKSSYLFYEGEIPLTLGEQNKNIFKTSAKPYILKILFYFYKNKLSMFIFYYNPKKISVFEKLKSLIEKYGNPQKIDSFRFFWEDSETLMILQKDNILKVIDKKFIEELNKENNQLKEIEKLSREQIFDNF